VRSVNLKIAGDKFNTDIIGYLRDEFKLLIGEKTAESVKIAIGSVAPGEPMEAEVRGRDLVTGLPREVVITDADIREAMGQSILGLIDGIKEVLETTPPEILGDIMHRGIVLSGGGAMLHGLDTLLQNMLKIPVTVTEDPLTAVARGAGIVLEDLEYYKEVLLPDYDTERSK